MTPAETYVKELLDRHPVPPSAEGLWRRDTEMVKDRAVWLRNSLSGKARAAIDETPVALLPTGEINACAASVPKHRDKAVVLLEFRLTLALEFLIDLAFWVLLDWNERDDSRFIQIAQALCDLFTITILDSGDFRSPKIPQDEKAYPAKMITLANSMTFILGHEFAHVSEGHLKNAKRIKKRIRTEDIETFNYDQRLELRADELGFKWLLDAAPSLEGPVLGGPLLVCSLFGAHDHIRKCLTNEDPTTTTHPTGFVRFDRLLDRFGTRLDETAKTLAIGFHKTILRSLMMLDQCDLSNLEKCLHMSRRS